MSGGTSIFLKKVHPDAVMPIAKEGNVGYDLHAVEDVVVSAGSSAQIRTGLIVADYVCHAPECLTDMKPYMKVEGRSGLALEKQLFPIGGIIDPSYRGEIIVILYNGNKMKSWSIKKGDRVAQLVLYFAVCPTKQHEVKFVERKEVTPTERGAAGFGASGR